MPRPRTVTLAFNAADLDVLFAALSDYARNNDNHARADYLAEEIFLPACKYASPAARAFYRDA